MSAIQYDDEWSRRILTIYQTPDVVAQRQAVLSALKLREGEEVLDVGSGPGLLARDVAEQVGPRGRVLGVDISEAMNSLARQVCADYDYVAFEGVDATHLPFADGSFDVAVSTQVYEYIEDLNVALDELYRVLKLGGRALLLDTDWETLIWHTENRERMRRILDAFENHCSNPRLPRTLASCLRASGFEVDAQSVYVLLNTAYDPNTYTYGLLDFIASYVVEAGHVPEEEAQAWLDEQRRLGEEGRYFCSNNRYLFSAVKPFSLISSSPG